MKKYRNLFQVGFNIVSTPMVLIMTEPVVTKQLRAVTNLSNIASMPNSIKIWAQYSLAACYYEQGRT